MSNNKIASMMHNSNAKWKTDIRNPLSTEFSTFVVDNDFPYADFRGRLD